MIFLVILLMTFKGIFADHFARAYGDCSHHIPLIKIDETKIVPNEEELMEICPGKLRFYECFDDHFQERNTTYPLSLTEVFRNEYGIAKDLCDESSSLHKAYIDSVECYRTLEGIGNNCEQYTRSTYEHYFYFLEKGNSDQLETFESNSNRRCMKEIVKIACVHATVKRMCGEEADSTLLEMVKRTQYLRMFCSPSFTEILKTSYLDKLTMEEERNIFASVFDILKK